MNRLKYERIKNGCGSEEIIAYRNKEHKIEISQITSWDTPSVLEAWVGKRNNVEKTKWTVYYMQDKQMDYSSITKVKEFRYLNDAKRYVNENLKDIKSGNIHG